MYRNMTLYARTSRASALALLLAFPAAAAGTEIYIGVGAAPELPRAPLALAQFLPEDPAKPQDIELASGFRDIVRADLLYSRYFSVMEDQMSPFNLKEDKKALKFWKTLGDHLVTATAGDHGKVWTFRGRLRDLKTGEVLLEKFYQGERRGLRRAAHLFSDEIIMKLTGRRGIAHSKIAFANDSTGKKEIYIADYDGGNLTRLTSHNSISLLPRWSQDGSRIYYTTWKYGNPDMFEIDLRAGKIKPFTTFQGLNIPGGASPDGGSMVMTLSRGGDPSIYALDLKTKELSKLLKRFGVSSSASFSPDGKEVTFISDRAGNPQVYVLELATGKTRRLTKMLWCDTPSWSPSGEWLVFAGREDRKEKMNIFLVDPTGSQLRRVTSGAGDNEDPSWSPDGRFIAFTSTRRGKREIFVMDADGSAPHPLTDLPGNSFTPSWSR
jgi:TolB protein